MKQNLLYNMLADVWGDLGDPNLLWQIFTLATCLAAGWWLARLLKARVASSDSQSRVVRLGVQSFARVLWPLIALVLVFAATAVLSYFQPVSLLRLAIPLIASFALIRLVFYVLRRAFAKGGKAGAFLLLSETVIATVVWACVALYIAGLWPDVINYLDKTVLPIGRHKVSLLTIVQATASVLVTLMFALW
ncbi:MAG TPA: mechanosensitive ion channel protein, partial [Noviherbaspirillum sp.]|nr:mechanosensitive ion channel protein [Noviherbaspirillum sp.]